MQIKPKSKPIKASTESFSATTKEHSHKIIIRTLIEVSPEADCCRLVPDTAGSAKPAVKYHIKSNQNVIVLSTHLILMKVQSEKK